MAVPDGARKLSWEPPQVEPPPRDAVRLYIRWQAAEERLAELQRTLPPAGESAAGGVVMPLLDERVTAAMREASEASIAFHRHPWWFGAFSKSEAERVIGEAAARLGEGP